MSGHFLIISPCIKTFASTFKFLTATERMEDTLTCF